MLGITVRPVSIALALLALNTGIISYALVLGDQTFHAENGILENLQATCLGATTIAYLLCVWGSRGQLMVCVGVALLSFSFLLRELDLDAMNVPRIVQTMGSGPGRIALLASLWGCLLCYFVAGISSKRSFVTRFLRSSPFALLTSAFGLLLLSATMDKNLFAIDNSRFFEELLEANAYALLFMTLFCSPMRVWPEERPARGSSLGFSQRY